MAQNALPQNVSSAPPTGATPAQITSLQQQGQPHAAPAAAPQPAVVPVTPPIGSQQNVVKPPPFDPASIDPAVVKVMSAIRNVESQGNYNAIGDNGSSHGAYQWNNGNKPVPAGDTPENWKTAAKQFLGSADAPMTPENQNYVAYHQIAAYKAQGLTPNSIDALWNGARPDPTQPGQYVHVNPDRANEFNKVLANIVGGQADQNPTKPYVEQPPTYGATFPASPNDTGLTAGFKALGNLPSSAYGFGAGIVGMLLHPLQTAQTVGQGVIGGVENLSGQNAGGAPDSNQEVANAIGHALMQRYGSLDALQNTATNDPFGLGTDILSVLAGGEGLLAKGADVADLASGGRAAQAAKNAAGFSETGVNAMPANGVLGTAARTGIDAVNSAGQRAAQAVISPLGGALGRAGKGLSALVPSANQEVLSASQRTGVALPAGALTSNPLIRAIDTLGLTGLGNESAIKRLTAAAEQMDTVANNIVRSTNGVDDLEAAGRSISQGLKEYDAAFRKTTGAMYDTIQKEVGDMGAQTSASVRTIGKILDDKAMINDTKDVKYFQDKYGLLTGFGKQKAPTLSVLRKLRTNLGETIDNGFADPFVTSNKAALKQMYGALTSDIKATIQATRNPKLLELYNEANKTYIAGRTEIASQFGRTIRRLAKDGQYSKIADALLKPSTAIEDIPRIMAVVGEEGANNLRATFVRKVLDAARNSEGDFTPEGILRQIKKYGEDRVGLILHPEQLQGLKDLGTLTKSIGDSLKMAQGSQTAFLLRTMTELGAFGYGAYQIATGDLIGGLHKMGAVIGSEGASMFISSKAGQQLLRWALTRGAEFKAEGTAAGITAPPETDTMKGNGPDTGNGGGGGGLIPSDSRPNIGGDSPAAAETGAKSAGNEAAASQMAVESDGAELQRQHGDPNLSPEQKAIELSAFNEIASEGLDKKVNDYIAKYGNYVSGDDAKELFKDYNPELGGTRANAAAIQEAASTVSKAVFNKLLEENKGKGNNTVLFTGGGTGAGKTSAFNRIAAMKVLKENSSIIYDSNLAKFDSAVQKIDAALAAGYKVNVGYTYREIIDAWKNGVLPRAQKMGRPIPPDVHISTHVQMVPTALKLMEHYKNEPNVQLFVIDNSGKVPQAVPKSGVVDFLAKKVYNKAYEERTRKQIG